VTIRYRQTWRQVLPPAVIFAVTTAVWGMAVRSFGTLAAVGAICGGIGAAFGERREGVEVGPAAITVIGVRRRTFPWSRVSGVEHVGARGGRGLRIHVDGRRIHLKAPMHVPRLAPDPDFEEKAETIERLWREATGP
jgi:hypothetical protein